MVYTPAEDSFLLAKQVEKYAKGKTVLDIGSGSGVQSETAIKAGAKSVLAVDIDPESIRLLKKKKPLGPLDIRKSDLFEEIKTSEKFDLIVFNPPYLPEDEREPQDSRRATTGGKKGDEIILKFLKQAVNHLNKEGIILLLVSSLTPQDRINKLFDKLKLGKKKIAQEKIFMEKLEVWEIRKE